MIIDLNSEEQKMLLEILDLRLKLLSCDENVSLGLHTTDNEGNAKNICKTGLIIKSNRSFEGTVWPIGKIKDIEISDLNYFYRLGDYTIIVAVPPQFKVDNNRTRRISSSFERNTSLRLHHKQSYRQFGLHCSR